MNPSQSLGATCAIVVTYHPPADSARRIRELAAGGIAVIVVDNGSIPAQLQPIAALAEDTSVEVLRNDTNLGIATALNRGVRRALRRGFRWAILLDQDSELPAGTVGKLLAIAAIFPLPNQLAVIGARFEDPMQRMSAPLVAPPPNSTWEEVDAVITSGSLLSLPAFEPIGAFRDELFIDFVDIDFCLRARRKGFRILRSKEVLFKHAVGEPRQGRFLWLKKWTTNHSAERRYYIARNDTVMLRESGAYPHGGWIGKSAARRLQLCKRVVLFEDRKWAKVVATVQGFWDGVRGRLGPRRRR